MDYEIATTIEVWDPEKADHVLKNKNIRNRVLNKNSVTEFSDQIMKQGFLLTHQGIAFDRNDFLMDGQHRLAGIVRADMEVRLMVFRYSIDLIQPDGKVHPVMMIFDKGRTRTIGANLRLNGMQNANLIAAICNAIRLSLLHSGSKRANEAAIEAIYSIYHSSIDAIMSIPWGPRDKKATLMAVLVMFHAIHPERATQLAEKIATLEGLRAKTPEMALSNFLRGQLGDMTGHDQRVEAMDRIINACVKYLDGESVQSLCVSESAKERFLGFHKKQREILLTKF